MCLHDVILTCSLKYENVQLIQGPSYGVGVPFESELAPAGLAVAPSGVFVGAVAGVVSAVLGFSTEAGVVEAAGTALLSVPVIMNPVGPVTFAPSFGSMPNKDPFLRFSTAGILGTSSRLTGLTV